MSGIQTGSDPWLPLQRIETDSIVRDEETAVNKDVYDFREDLSVRKVSLEKVLRHALTRWKLVLLAGVILGGLFGCYKILNEHRQKSQITAARDAYETQMEAYKHQQEDIRAQVASLQAKITARQKYMNESIKMQLDPMACPQAFAEINVIVPEVDPNDEGESKSAIYKLTSIMKAYYDDILFGTASKELADKYGIDKTYFAELIAPMYDYYTSSIRIQVRYTDEETALLILNDILQMMDEDAEYYRTVFGDYELEVYIKDSVTIADIDLSTYQMQKANELSTLQSAVNNAIYSQANLTIPNPVKSYSRRQLLKDGIKFAVVGFAGGCFLMVLFLMCWAIIRGKIFTPDEIDGAYGLRNLASFAYSRTKDLPAEIDYALAQLENALQGKEIKKIAVVGTIGEKKLAAMRKALSDSAARSSEGEAPFTFTAVPSVSEDAAALRTLPSYDGFLLVEEIGKSRYKSVQNELRLLSETGREVVGTVYL